MSIHEKVAEIEQRSTKPQPTLHQKMHAIMKAINYVSKESRKINNQYTFVSHDAVTKLVREQLVQNGVLSIPTVKSHGLDGNKTIADVEVKFVNVDDREDFISVNYFGYGVDNQDKGPGKAMSYAVKYAYLKVFALETGDDPERDNINHVSQAEMNTIDMVKQISETRAVSELEKIAEEIKNNFKGKELTILRGAYAAHKKKLQTIPFNENPC